MRMCNETNVLTFGYEWETGNVINALAAGNRRRFGVLLVVLRVCLRFLHEMRSREELRLSLSLLCSL